MHCLFQFFLWTPEIDSDVSWVLILETLYLPTKKNSLTDFKWIAVYKMGLQNAIIFIKTFWDYSVYLIKYYPYAWINELSTLNPYKYSSVK